MPTSKRPSGFAENPQEAYRSKPMEVSVHEAKTHLSRLLERVEAGESLVITRRGKPVAKLEALQCKGPRKAGALKGLISIDERFFEPLPEEELRAWEGEDD